MKYRYPLRAVWLPALLLALCLAMTLISTIAWLLIAATAEDTGGSAATTESVIPALLMLACWIGCGILAGRMRLRSFLWFGLIFWSVELLLYLLCLIPPIFQSAQNFFSLATLPMWSYFALIELFAAQSQAANAILTILPTLALLFTFAWQLWSRKKAHR